VRAGIFRLGRLTFRAGQRPWPFRAFRNRRTGEVITLCEGGTYRRDGLANNTNGIVDPAPWTPVLEIGEDAVTGCPVSREGIAIKEPVMLRKPEWDQVMAPGDDSVEVQHRGGGSPLLARNAPMPMVRPSSFFQSITGKAIHGICVRLVAPRSLAAENPAA